MLSLNARVTLGASVVLAVFVALAALALDRAFEDSARAAMQDRLLGQTYLLMAEADVDASGHLLMPTTLPEPRLGLPESGLYAQIVDGDGRVLWRSASVAGTDVPFAEPLSAAEQRFSTRATASGQPFYVLGFGINWALEGERIPYTFSVSEDLSAQQAQLTQYRHTLWGWLGGMAALLLLMQTIILRWGLRPMRQVVAELSEIETGAQETLRGHYPTELKRLTDKLNGLLRHERARQARYRDALGDLAHSMKTPLAILRAAGGTEDDTQRLTNVINEQVARMEYIVEYQLQRAATVGARTLAAPVPVEPILVRLLESLDKVYRDKAVTASIDIQDGLCLGADEGDLLELLGNVLDNAYKWCRKQVAVSAIGAGDRVTIGVEDDGPGIRASDKDLILQRGTRADEAVPGHGIGLAVVNDIVRAYQGEIEVSRSDLGGAAIRLTLPAA